MPFLREVICYKTLMYFSSPPFLDSSGHNPASNDWHYHSPEGAGGITNSCALLTLVATSEQPPADTEQQVQKFNYSNETLRSFEFCHFS